jgi:ribosome-associated toxin RatA of RatAB toxin-antitoxin module
LPTVERSARVQYTAEQMFDLVNDVERYPEFLHWCRAARVLSRTDDVVEASMDVGMLGFHQSLRTRNTLERPERIRLGLVSGPFKKLDGEWRFTDLVGGGSDVSLNLHFEVALSPFGLVFSKVFEEIAGAQMHAFVTRAASVYGTSGT